MYAFLLSFILFYAIVITRFDNSIRPTLNKISTNSISLPDKLITFWLIVTSSLFPLNAVMKARKSSFDLEESLPFMALIFGVILGMVAEVHY